MVVRRSARKSYLLALALLLVVVVAAYGATELSQTGHPLPQYPSPPYALLPIALASIVLVSYLKARSRVYTLDENAAVVQWGLLAHHRFGVPLRHVATLKLKQSPLDRVLGLGTVELWTRDQHGMERRLVMDDVPRPRQTYEELTRFMGTAAQARVHQRIETEAPSPL